MVFTFLTPNYLLVSLEKTFKYIFLNAYVKEYLIQEGERWKEKERLKEKYESKRIKKQQKTTKNKNSQQNNHYEIIFFIYKIILNGISGIKGYY